MVNLSREVLLGTVHAALRLGALSLQLQGRHIVRGGQFGQLAVTVQVDRYRLVINLAVAVEVDTLPGGLTEVEPAVGVAAKAGTLIQLVLVQGLVGAGRVAELQLTAGAAHTVDLVHVVHDAQVVRLVVHVIGAAVTQTEVVAQLVDEGTHAHIGGCGLTPETRTHSHDESAATHVAQAGGAVLVVGVTPDHVVEDAFTVGVHVLGADFGPLGHGVVQLLVGDFVAAAEVVLGAAGATCVQVDVDAGGAVRVAEGQLREGFGDAVKLFFAGEQVGHVVHLHEDVLLQRVGAHAGVVHVDFAVAVGVVALHFPGVGDAVAVNVGVVRLRCGNSNRAKHQQCRRGERGTHYAS